MAGFRTSLCGSHRSVEDDTLIAAYLLDPNRANYRPKELAREFLGLEMAETVEGFDEDSARTLQTADLTLQLVRVLREKITEMQLDRVYREIELPLVEILFDMERIGVRIDLAALDKAGREWKKSSAADRGDLQARRRRVQHQLSRAARRHFRKLNFEVGRKTKTGKISTSVDVLEELAFEVRAAPKDHRLSRDRQAEEHLRRRAAEAD